MNVIKGDDLNYALLCVEVARLHNILKMTEGRAEHSLLSLVEIDRNGEGVQGIRLGKEFYKRYSGARDISSALRMYIGDFNRVILGLETHAEGQIMLLPEIEPISRFAGNY